MSPDAAANMWAQLVMDHWIDDLEVSIVMGVPHSWIVYVRESPMKMEDAWGNG